MTVSATNRLERLEQLGVSRRQFLKFCGLMAATLALPAARAPEIAKALGTATRLPVVWLAFQDCTGDTIRWLEHRHPRR